MDTSDYSANLADFVVSPIEITDSLGNPVTTYYLNSDYYIKINFSETAVLQFEYFHDEETDTDYMTYQLPPELKVQQSLVDQSPFPMMGESISPEAPEPIIGYVSIDIDGLIKVHFDDVDIYGNPALVYDEDLEDYVLVNFIDYYSDVSFLLDIAARFAQAGSQQSIDFGNDVVVTLTVENPLPGTLDIAKTSDMSKVIADQTITFTVTITALDGTVGDITLDDFEIPGINGLLPDAIFKTMTVSIAGGTAYTPPEFATLAGEPFGDGFSLAFPGVTLTPTQQIKVDFTLDIAGVISQWIIDNPSDAAGFSYDFILYNRAVTQGVDEYDTPTPTVTADNSAYVRRQFFNKTGQQDLNHDYTIIWTNLTVGDGVTPLNGYTITDTFTGLVFGDDNLLPNGQNGVILNFLDPTDTQLAFQYLTVPGGATGFSFVVPPVEEYGTIARVTISQIYDTTVADISDFDDVNTVTYHNTIAIDISDPNPSYTVGVDVTKPGRLPTAAKSGTFGGDGETIDYVEWTYTIYVPKEAYGHPISITDDSFVGYNGLSRLYPRVVPQNLEVKVYSDDLGERILTRNVDFTLLDPDHTNGYTNIGNTWYLVFVGDTTGLVWGELLANSLWPYEGDSWLTMTFRVPLDVMCYDGDIEMTLLEALQKHTTLSNYLYINSYLLAFDTTAAVNWPLNKTATVNENTVQYQISFTTDDFDFSYTDIFTDIFDPRLEYVPFSMRVWQGGTPDSYGLYEMVGEVFTDMLAESLAGNTISFDFTNMYSILWDAGGASYLDDPTLLSDNPIAGTFYIAYTLKLKDDPPIGQYILDNNTFLDGFANHAEAIIGDKIVDKTMAATSNVASVSIIINPDAIVLAGEAGQYTVTDTLSDTLLIYISTMKVEAWEGGAWVAHALTPSTSGDIWSYATAGANQVSLVVPDSTTLRIIYSALITGIVGDTVTIHNQVTVAGLYDDDAEAVFLITDTSASGTGSRTILTVTKHDADAPEILLEGAIFALYIGVPYAGRDLVIVPPGIDKVITLGSVDFYYVSSGVTADNGQLVFDSQWLTPTHMAVYAIKEYQSAIGYEIPAEPIRLFSYTVPSDTQLEALAPYTVQQVADTLAVPNTEQADLHAIIEGYKTVTGADAPDKIFTYYLTQVSDASGTAMPSPYTDTTTTLGQGAFGFPLFNLGTNKTYFYKITEETTPPDPNWVYDPQGETGYIVTVAVGWDGSTNVIYPGGGSYVSFTNKYKGEDRPVKIALSANKIATGAPLPAKRFWFGLFDGIDSLIDVAANAPAGEA